MGEGISEIIVHIKYRSALYQLPFCTGAVRIISPAVSVCRYRKMINTKVKSRCYHSEMFPHTFMDVHRSTKQILTNNKSCKGSFPQQLLKFITQINTAQHAGERASLLNVTKAEQNVIYYRYKFMSLYLDTVWYCEYITQTGNSYFRPFLSWKNGHVV